MVSFSVIYCGFTTLPGTRDYECLPFDAVWAARQIAIHTEPSLGVDFRM